MKAVAGLALLLVNVRLSRSCYGEGNILFCLNIPQAFRPGYSSLVMVLRDVGEVNSTVLHSDKLSSVTRLRIEKAGVTGIAEAAFSSFQNLTNLSLNQNLLTEVNPKWLGRPEILSELTLTENLIEVLNGSMLSGLVALTTLSLDKNRIRAIDLNSFSSNTILAELDLSGNRMTRVSPQAFSSLRSTRIGLDGNPWDCSCGAEDFVDFLKDLRSRSLLDRPMEVTCASPPSLRGRPVWNVSACATSPPPGTPSATQAVFPKPTDVLTTAPASSAKVVTPSTRPTSKAETSVQPKPTDAPLISSSHPATPPARPTPETKTSAQPKPTDTLTLVTTTTLKTASSPPSPTSVTEISVHPKPSDLLITASTPPGATETCATSRPSSDANTICALVVVIVVLSLLLFVACFLVVLHRRKRNNKAVMPGCPNDNGDEQKGAGGRSSPARPPEHRDSETGWRRSFTGVRAKSANAVLFTSPFCAPVKDQVTLQTETEAQSKDAGHQAEGKQEPGDETEVGGGMETESLTNTTEVNAKQAASGSSPDETALYLSIGTNHNKPSPDDFKKLSTDGPGQRPQTRRVMGRISTWPPTASQWQARCKMKEEEEEGGCDVFTDWTAKFPEVLNKVEHPSGSDQEPNQMEDPLKMNGAHRKLEHTRSSKPHDKSTDARLEEHEDRIKKGEVIQDPAAVRQTMNRTQEQLQDLKENPAGKNANKSRSKAEQRSEPKDAATSRRRAGDRSTGSKAPSGGASPDDATLLSGNEYAFMDLLHEVVQNNGRWTRERWKQMHVNKQRR